MRWLAALLFLLLTPAHAGTVGGITPGPHGPLVDTYVIWGDTQSIVFTESNTPLASGTSDMETLAGWACDRVTSHNVKSVISMGDMVEFGENQPEWDIVNEATAILDGCRIPFFPTVGNHEFSPYSGVQQPNFQRDATLYHQNQGQDVMDAKGWFQSNGFRPDYTEVNSDTGVPLYLENTTTYKSRSFVVSLNKRLKVIVGEWEIGARLSRGANAGVGPGTYGATYDWVTSTMRSDPKSYYIFVTHAGPCAMKSCDLTPEDAGLGGSSPGATDWENFLEGYSNMAMALGGHWNRTSCTYGAGQLRAAMRDDGTRWLAGSFDFSCPTREDPNGSTFTNNPYTWQGWAQLKRDSGQLCLRQVRMLDVDADNDGFADTDPAAKIEEYDRGGVTYADPPLAVCQTQVNDAEPSNCPSATSEVCIPIYQLPGVF